MQPTNPQIQAFIEQLYETENLTDALTDASASLLLHWGEQQLNSLTLLEPEQIESVARLTRRVMRAINRLIETRSELSEAEGVQQLLELIEQAGQLALAKSGAPQPPQPEQQP